MYGSLEELYSSYFSRPFDQSLLNDLRMFRINWAQKEDIYIEFLGGNTLGTQAIRFSIKDDEMLIVDTLNMDITSLSYDITNTKGITKGRAAETNVIYQTLVYLMHGFIKSSKLNNKLKEEALKECYYIFAYKKFSSLMFHYFKYPTEEAIAKAVYEKLSSKFLIKRLNNWQEVFEYRAKDILPNGIHGRRLMDYDTDDAIRIILDLQTKLNDMFKNVYSVTVQVANSNERIVSDSLFTTIDGNEDLKTITNAPDRYIKYIKSIINSKNDFVKYDLTHLVAEQFNKLVTSTFYNYLISITELDQKTLDILTNVAIIETIETLANKGIIKDYHKHILEVISIIKQKYSNGKYDSKDCKQLKKILEKQFCKLNPKASYVASRAAIGVIMYTFIRCFYKE